MRSQHAASQAFSSGLLMDFSLIFHFHCCIFIATHWPTVNDDNNNTPTMSGQEIFLSISASCYIYCDNKQQVGCKSWEASQKSRTQTEKLKIWWLLDTKKWVISMLKFQCWHQMFWWDFSFSVKDLPSLNQTSLLVQFVVWNESNNSGIDLWFIN